MLDGKPDDPSRGFARASKCPGRVNFSRVEWRVRMAAGVRPPQELVDMHVPEHGGFVKFAARQKTVPQTNSGSRSLVAPPANTGLTSRPVKCFTSQP
jgi:hypothetical protein